MWKRCLRDRGKDREADREETGKRRGERGAGREERGPRQEESEERGRGERRAEKGDRREERERESQRAREKFPKSENKEASKSSIFLSWLSLQNSFFQRLAWGTPQSPKFQNEIWRPRERHREAERRARE